MKPELNKKDQSKQKKLRKMLAAGLPLSALLTGLLGGTACDNIFTRTTGDVPNTEPCSEAPQEKPAKKQPEPKPLAGEPPRPVIRGKVAPQEPVYYEVRKGDTLSSIAKRHGTTAEQLKKLNGFTDKSAAALKAGQKIRIR